MTKFEHKDDQVHFVAFFKLMLTDNTMAKRRTDNTMAKRRTENTMAKRRRTEGQTMIYKTLHIILKIV
jgi:hypothetical protein